MPTIQANNQSLTKDVPYSFLAQDYSSTGVTELDLQNVSQADFYTFVVIGEINNEQTELIKISSVDSDNNTITLSDSTKYAHPLNTTVYFVKWDRIEFHYADNDEGEDKELIDTKDIYVSDRFTYFTDDSHTEGFGFLRLINSDTDDKNLFSDPIPYGYREKSARTMKNSALMRLGEDNNHLITDNYTIQLINQCETEVSNMRKTWNWLRVTNHILGTLKKGGWKLPVPSDIKRNNTNESIEMIHVGDGKQLHYVDINEWKDVTKRLITTSITSDIDSDTEDIPIENGNDFKDSGTVYIGDNVVKYDSKDEDFLYSVSGVDNSVNEGATVFSQRPFGNPQWYTVYGGNIYVYPVPNKDETNVYISYVKNPGNIKRMYNETIIPDSTIVIDYLTKEFDMRINRAMTNIGQIAQAKYEEKVDMLRRKETSSRKIKIKPAIRKKI